jgi:site-specific recombinase XerD
MRHRLRHPAAADDAMFRTATGRLWASDRINHAMTALTEGGWRFHALRHVFATTMLTQGRSIKAVQKILGHSSASTTIDTYWHFVPDEEDLVRGTAGDLVRDLQGIAPAGRSVADDGAVPRK